MAPLPAAHLAVLRDLGVARLLGPGHGVSPGLGVGGGVATIDVDAHVDRALWSLSMTADDDAEVATMVMRELGHACGHYVDAGRVRARRETLRAYAAAARALRDGPQAGGIEQRTAAWYAARAGLVTASDIAQALGCGKFGTQRDFFKKKCGGAPPPEGGSGGGNWWGSGGAMPPPLKWGILYEPVASELYRRWHGGVPVHEYGLLRHQGEGHDFLGASPDGITEQGIMLEIKCPWRRRGNGEIPAQYYLQILGQLAVCGLRECDYFEVELEETAPPEAARALADAGTAWAAFEPASDDEDAPACAWCAAAPDRRGLVVEVPVADAAAGGGTGARFLYAPLHIGGASAERAREWVARTEPALLERLDVRWHWWTVRAARVQRVRMDDAVWAATVERLRGVWADVQRYRADPAAFAREVLDAVPRSSRRSPAVEARDAGDDAGDADAGGAGAPCWSTYAFVDDAA